MSVPLDLRSLTLGELERVVTDEWALPRFRARQIFAWVHGRGASTTQVMTDLGRELRGELDSKVGLDPLVLAGEQTSADGTRKLRLTLADGAAIETVLIPDGDKLTQCLSTQVGCNLGCRFCATASMGLARDLSAGEIVDQVYRARERLAAGSRVSNLVLMGMGEPLNNLDAVLAAIEILCTDIGANFSPRRITISTAGVVPGIDALGQRNRHIGLAVSLNATTDEVRAQVMPQNKSWPIAALLDALREDTARRRGKRDYFIEYVLFGGLNDTDADVERLVALLRGIPSRVNLIPYNPYPGTGLRTPTTERVLAFHAQLVARGVLTLVRWPRGREIAAACGQLVLSRDGEGFQPPIVSGESLSVVGAAPVIE